jgi:hypothetical protein
MRLAGRPRLPQPMPEYTAISPIRSLRIFALMVRILRSMLWEMPSQGIGRHADHLQIAVETVLGESRSQACRFSQPHAGARLGSRRAATILLAFPAGGGQCRGMAGKQLAKAGAGLMGCGCLLMLVGLSIPILLMLFAAFAGKH